MSKILIIEDEESINQLLKETLIKDNHQCVQAYSGTEGLLCMKDQDFDLVLLDFMLPGLKGDKVLAEIKRQYSIPVIIVSAIDEMDKKIDLLTLGAEDYITKPFDIKELKARVAVQLRRLEQGGQVITSKAGKRLQHKQLELVEDTYQVFVGEKEISLTRQEFKIVELLLRHPDKVFTKQEIYEFAWDDFYIGEDKTINVHISNIRSKIKKITDEEYIETVWGIGFKLAK